MTRRKQAASTEPGEIVRHWLAEIGAAKKREKDFRKEGQRILEIYEAQKNASTPFNILFSNTETLLPAIYSAVPRPVVQRRFKDADPLGNASAQAGQRVLEFLLDTNVEGYETFDEAMTSGTLDALLPGRGWTCVKYDADLGELPTESTDDETPTGDMGAPPAANAEPLTGQVAPPADPAIGSPYVKSELVCLETRSWDRVYHGYAKKWSKVPWIAYEEQIDQEEAIRLFGKEMAAKLTYSEEGHEDDDEDRKQRSKDEENQGERKTAVVYQIWDKEGGKKIRYISAAYPDGYLLDQDEPLQLTGFYNCPRPMTFVAKSNSLMPTALYTVYENQAKELNKLTVRIQHIVQAIKARGVYDSELGEEIANLMKAEDNELVPADKSSSLAAEKGLQNAIWFMPIEQLIGVLTQLYQAREQCKQVIYEITGIADIMRGATQASETATAQNIKSQWGTLRLKRLQKEVQRYSRDLLRLMLEIAATKFSEETWAKMTGLPFLTAVQRQQLDQLAKAAQQATMQGQQVSPQTQQQLQQGMAAPQWKDVLALLKDDIQRAYRIDIETNSTVEPEAAEDQKQITELMTAIGQYLNGVGPLVQKQVLPMEAAKSMLLAICRRFRFGSEVEDSIQQMQQPPPQDDGKAGEQAKVQAEAQAKQAELQQQAQVEIAKHQREVQAEQNRQAQEAARLQAQQAIETARMQAEQQREAMRLEFDRRTKQSEQQQQRAMEQHRVQIEAETRLAIAKLEAETKVLVAQIMAGASAASAQVKADASVEVAKTNAEAAADAEYTQAVEAP